MNEPKWIKAPPDYEKEIPFLKGVPIKAIENSSMQYQVETPKGKILLKA